MKVCITGASGMIGSALAGRLRSEGHKVIALVRSRPRDTNERQWTPGTALGPASLADADVVVHLAGKNIGVRWTDSAKREILSSRIDGTSTIARALAESFRTGGKPSVLVSASAIGIYGDRGDEVLTEESATGTGFLPDVGREWESGADPARQAGVRVVHPRMGLVLTREGGALARMLLPFKLGVGGRIGDGRQYWSWITLPDVVDATLFCIANSGISGIVNFTAPNPVSNREFTKILGSVLHRPTVFPTPKLALRIVLGEGADELLLASARVIPSRLQSAGYSFRHRDLRSALEAALP